MAAEQLKEETLYPPAELYRVGDIAGMFYPSLTPSDRVVIYGIGAPIPPDSGNLPDANVIRSHGYDVFVPDYIGYGRSDGTFTPEGCVRTFTFLFDQFSQGCEGRNSYADKIRPFHYEDIAFVGRSLGAVYVPLLPKYDSRISELAIVCPVVENKTCGSMPGEESNEQWMRAMSDDGYHHLYRGILDDVWERHLIGEDEYSPMDNIQFLENARLFIGHGLEDHVVHHSKSVNYYNQIMQTFPQRQNQFMLQLYSGGGHDRTTTNRAVADFLKWIGGGK